ncbi:MAG: OmpA family protein [Elusimicrobiota bacterium]|nr:OmpA family protein [Elusimicrobiota bacterium]
MKSMKIIRKIIFAIVPMFFIGYFSYAAVVPDWDTLRIDYQGYMVPGFEIEFNSDISQTLNSDILGTARDPGGIINGNEYFLIGGADSGAMAFAVFTITEAHSSARGKTITFLDVLFKNFTGYERGIIYGVSDSSITFAGSTVRFEQNSGNYSYGVEGISLYLMGKTFFTVNDALFEYNTAMSANPDSGGAAIRAVGGDSKTSFTGSTVRFIYNTSIQNGGAIYAESGASILFNGNTQVSFENNLAYNEVYNNSKGAAVYMVDSQLIFKDVDNVSFSNNTSYLDSNGENAGAIFAQGSDIIFSGSQISFENNVTTITGIINTAAGAIYAWRTSISFVDSSARFYDNWTSVGADIVSAGSIFANELSTLAFVRSTVTFADGGRDLSNRYSQDSSIIIKNSVIRWTDSKGVFGNNISTSFADGGAALKLFAENSYKSFMFSQGSQIDFTQNTSKIGAALYTYNSSIVVNSSIIKFENNTALSSGGAIYAGRDVKMYFFDSTITFLSNTAVGRGDAIYLAENAQMTFIGGLVSFNYYGDINLPSDIWYLETNARMDFSSGSVEAIGNKADSGGFLSLSNRNFTFGRNVNFVDNTARDMGGALYLTNNARVNLSGNSIFNTNTAGQGGAIYLLDSTLASNKADMLFSGNESSPYGGAVYAYRSLINLNATTAVFNQNVSSLGGNSIYLLYSIMTASGNSVIQFSNNSTTDYGAGIYAENSTMSFSLSSAAIAQNSANLGAGIYLRSSSLTINSRYINFSNNSAYDGAAINVNNSKMSISASTWTAVGNYASQSGGVFYVLGQASFGASSMNFVDNSAQSGGILYVTAGSSVNIIGSGIFTKNSANMGGAIYNAGFLNLRSVNSSMVFIDNSASAGKDIYNAPNSTISISGNSGSVEINSGIDGDGFLIKSGAGNFIINADNNFIGTFRQSAGTTTIAMLGKMFKGANFIERSLLKLTTDNPYRFDLTIGGMGIFEYYNASEIPFEINSADMRFNANNGIARFNRDASLSTKTVFRIANDIGNGSQNTLEFYNADVVFGSLSYNLKNTRYIFGDSAINLTSDAVVSNNVKTTSFSYLQASGTAVYLTFGLYVDASSKLWTDILYSAMSSGKLNIREIKVYQEFSGLLPAVDTYIEFSTRVLTGAGNILFEPITRWTNIVTDEYQYIINVDVSSSWISVIFARHPEDSLNVVNMDTGNRQYQTKIIAKLNPTSNTYHILDNLGETGAGNFYISSASASLGGVDMLSGLSRLDQISKGSFFKLLNNTQLIIDKLSISSAYASNLIISTMPAHGSVIYMTNPSASAILRDTNLSYNSAVENGGALYASGGGQLTIESASRTVSIINNSAQSGGVVYLSGSNATIMANKNIAFSNNFAADGGVLFGNANSRISFSGTGKFQISFLSNTAADFGAVFHVLNSYFNFAGGLSILANNTARYGGGFYSVRSSIVFTNNTANWANNRAGFEGFSDGLGGSFYLDQSTLNFNSSLLSWTGNTASSQGGALYIASSSVNFNNSTASFVNSRSGGGGIFFADNSKINFRNGTFNFNNSFSASNGGAFYLQASTIAISASRAVFNNNSASNGGGAFYADYSSASFIRSSLTFSGASAADGAAFYLLNSNIFFTSGAAIFSNAKASNNGGVFYLIASTLNFSGVSISFANNSAKENGNIIYGENSSISLLSISSGITFQANQGKNDIYIVDSNLTMQAREGTAITIGNGISAQNSTFDKKGSGSLNISKTFDFSNSFFNVDPRNKITIESVDAFSYIASAGISLNNSELSFRGSGVSFISNSVASNSGGALSASSSNISFANSQAGFSLNNAAMNGGAIYALGSSIVFTNSPSVFSQNTASQNGGAIYLDRGYGAFYETVFESNNAGLSGEGGALYLNRSKALITNARFENNSADGGGGAIYANDSLLEIIDSIFLGNSSIGGGGAIYLRNSTMTITANVRDWIFETAGDGVKYFYLSNSQLILDAKNGKNITIKNQIFGDNTNTITKIGSGNLSVGDIVSPFGKLDLTGGIFYSSGPSAAVITVGALNIRGGSHFKLYKAPSGPDPAIRNMSVGDLNIEEGILEIGAYIDPLAGSGDKIKVDTITDLTKVILNADNETKLIVRFYGLDISNVISQQNSAMYMDFMGGGVNYAGDFKWYSSPGLKGYRIKSIAGDTGAYLNIVPLRTIDNPTHNEKALLDLFASMDGGKDISIYLRNSIDDMIAMNPEAAKRALGQMSGGFYANALKMGAISNAQTVLYPRIQKINKDAAGGDIIKSVWVSGNVNILGIDSTENSILNFESSGYGVSAGYNAFTRKDSLVGVYVGYMGHSLTQDLDKADLSDIGIGVYGGSFEQDLIIKWNLGAGFQNYTFNRVIQLKDETAINPNSSFGAKSIKGGVEVEFLRDIGKDFTFKPFVGAQGAFAFNDKISEAGGDYANLTIDDDNYLRFLAMAGAILLTGDESHSWFLKAGINYLLAGARAQYQIGFASENERMEIWSNEENPLSFTLGAGLETVIWRAMSVYGNADARLGSGVREYVVNVGFNYRFEKTNKEMLNEFKTKAEGMESEMTAEAILKKQMRDLEESLLKTKIRIEEEAAGPISEEELRKQVRSEIELKKAKDAQALAEAEAATAIALAAAEAAKAVAEETAMNAKNNAAIAPPVASNSNKDSSLEQRLAAEDFGRVEESGGLPWAGAAIEPRRVVNTSFEEEEEDDSMLDDRALNEQISQAQSRKRNSASSKSAVRAFSLSAATFGAGSFELTAPAKRAIAKLAAEIQSRPFKKIVIEGHTDASGEIQKNLVLSHKRAREIRKELYKNGIPLNKMAYIGFGPTMPIATNNTELGRSKNRRVEIYVE